MKKTRKIFFVVASGGHGTDKHYYDTIERKRTTDEAEKFLTHSEIAVLKNSYHDGPFAVWGAVPGTGNIRTWETMEPGDYVLIYKSGRIIFAAEVALKVKNEGMARYLWGEDENKRTWEFMYFLVNTEKIDIPISKVNKYLEYSENYFPRGFMAIDQEKADKLLARYGDLLSALKKIEKGQDLEEAADTEKVEAEILEEKVERATTEHDEMQWRLIRLGKKAKVDVWVLVNDQGKSYEGHLFREQVLRDFQETLDIPIYVKNIDVVWKYGYSIKSAFEIENTTSVYSGILRLSDLRALTPNTVYPLFIVASREKRNKVFNELQRPTFDNPYLRLKDVVAFLSYDKIRELDEKHKAVDANLTVDFIIKESEKVSANI